MKATVALLALVVLLLAGCGSGHATNVGSIEKLRFTPAHNEQVEVTDYTVICAGGQYPSCYPIPIGSHFETDHHPDTWTATAFNCDAHGCWDFTRDVERKVYCGLAIGVWFDFEHPKDYLNTSGYVRADDPSCIENPRITAPGGLS